MITAQSGAEHNTEALVDSITSKSNQRRSPAPRRCWAFSYVLESITTQQQGLILSQQSTDIVSPDRIKTGILQPSIPERRKQKKPALRCRTAERATKYPEPNRTSMGQAHVYQQNTMTKFELLTDAQSEQVAGGHYLGANYNAIGQTNVGSAWAVGGRSESLFGLSNSGALASTIQGNNADIYNVVVSLF